MSVDEQSASLPFKGLTPFDEEDAAYFFGRFDGDGNFGDCR